MIAAHPSVSPTEAAWETISSRINEGLLVLERDGTIEFANAAALRLFDLQSDIVGQPFVTALATPELEAVVKAVFSLGEPQQRDIAVIRSGVSRSLSVRASKLDGFSPKGPGALLIFNDITAQRALEEMGSHFVANVSHELRTPISILTGYVENLADFPRMPRSEQAEIFGIMQDHAIRLKILLDDLLTLACFDSHSDVLNYDELDLNQFFSRLAKDWQPALASKDMTVVPEIHDDARFIRVDRFRFEQVMHNLFDNAFKYTPIEGQIRLRSLRTNAHIEISVEDNGAGIPEDDLPHIFERFYRVDKARSRKYGGTGLGLSIVKHIIALHGGSVRAESTLGMSTRIILLLPLSAPRP
jgi:PAS domain S-box-containing protein